MAWSPLLAIVAAKVAIHAVSSGPLAWGYMTDELYFLDSAARLDWGFVDHPPLSIALLAVVRSLFGDSLVAIRTVATAFAATVVLATGALARELGGGRPAQGLAALAALVSPTYLALCSYYSMNPIDQLIWALAMLILARMLNGAGDRHWLGVGVLVGLGLLNKVSMLWFAIGLAAGLLLTAERRRLATPWPWAAGLIALALWSPFVLWQWRHDWPFLEFSRNAALQKVGVVSPLRFFVEQIYVMNPVTTPLWLGGLVHCFTSPTARRYRPLAWIFITTALLLAFSGSARVHYLAPAFPIALAAGAVATELVARRRWLAPSAAIAFAIGGLIGAPLALPLLSPANTVAYARMLGLVPPQELEQSGPCRSTLPCSNTPRLCSRP